MIIILEGVDSVGKTTVAKGLLDLLPLSHYLKLSGAPKNEKNADYMKQVYRNIFPYLKFVGRSQHILLDRFTLSERVYAPMFKGYDPGYLDQYDDRLSKEVSIVQFLLYFESIASAIKRLEEKAKKQPNEEHPSVDTLLKIQDRYLNLYKESVFTTKLVPVNQDTTSDDIVKMIISELGLNSNQEKDNTYSRLLESHV